eukprot:scaffold93448_cov36-Phaeocystis_antarctica.AAC.1
MPPAPCVLPAHCQLKQRGFPNNGGRGPNRAHGSQIAGRAAAHASKNQRTSRVMPMQSRARSLEQAAARAVTGVARAHHGRDERA